MGATFFGQYLLSKGVISRDALIDAINLQRKKNLSLTALAVRLGYLDSQQEEEILFRYRTTDSKLEDLCLASGHLTRDQLDDLTRIQTSDWRRIGAALVEGGHLSRDEVEEHLSVFREMQRRADEQIEANFSACREPETVKTVVTLAMIHLGRISDLPVKLRSLNDGDCDLATGRRRFVQRLVGDRELHVVLDLPQEIELVVAEGLVDIPLESGSETAIDAVCEVVNIIGGNACTQLESCGFKLRPEPPYSTVDNGPVDGTKACVRAEILAGDTEADVLVIL